MLPFSSFSANMYSAISLHLWSHISIFASDTGAFVPLAWGFLKSKNTNMTFWDTSTYLTEMRHISF